MFASPFADLFPLSGSPKGHEGRYMAIFTMAYSLAHILSSKMGMEIIGRWGYQANWFFMGTLGLIALGFSVWLRKLLSQENN